MLNGPYRSEASYRGGGVTVLPEPVSAARGAERGACARIVGLTVSHAETAFSQAQVLERLGLAGDEFAERIFARSGVERRHLSLDADFLGRSLQGRAEQVERELLEHATRAVQALAIDPEEIGTVITASLYSLGVPTLAHRLIEHFGMDPTTDKYHLTGVGCASGVPLMRLAAQTLPDRPDKRALVVAAESMSSLLTRATPADPRAKTVGAAIFGDGCAAAALSWDGDADGPATDGPAILASQVHQLGGALGAVSLEVSAQDSYLHLARELPELAGAGLPSVVADFLARHQLERSDIDHWIAHPGGRRIIENVQSALGLSREDLATSWDALADHGNIGTPSIFYVLKDTIERCRPEPGEHGLVVSIGPGVTVGLMLLGW